MVNMERSEVMALLSPATLELLATTDPPSSKDEVLALVSRLRKAGHSPELTSAVMGQLALRAKAIDKFGEFAPRMLLTKEGLEQATRLSVASHHARGCTGPGSPQSWMPGAASVAMR